MSPIETSVLIRIFQMGNSYACKIFDSTAIGSFRNSHWILFHWFFPKRSDSRKSTHWKPSHNRIKRIPLTNNKIVHYLNWVVHILIRPHHNNASCSASSIYCFMIIMQNQVWINNVKLLLIHWNRSVCYVPCCLLFDRLSGMGKSQWNHTKKRDPDKEQNDVFNTNQLFGV